MSDAGEDGDGKAAEESRSLGYTAVIAVFALVGLTAVIVGFGGLFVVLTGGTADDGGSTEVPELADAGLQCDSFDGDPDVGHEGSTVGLDRGGTLVASVTQIPDGDDLLIEMTGPVVNASGVRTDDTSVTVSVDESAVVVGNGTAGQPYRLWIDSVDEDGQYQEGSVLRSQLDVCP